MCTTVQLIFLQVEAQGISFRYLSISLFRIRYGEVKSSIKILQQFRSEFRRKSKVLQLWISMTGYVNSHKLLRLVMHSNSKLRNVAAKQQISWVIAPWWIFIPFLWPSGSLLLPAPSSGLERHLHFALTKLCQTSWMWYRFSR